MSVHPNDVATLQRLIALVRHITARPHVAPDFHNEIAELGADIVAAIRCPAPGRHIGGVELIAVMSLAHLAASHIKSAAEAQIVAHTAQRLLPILGDHLFEAVTARGKQHA